MNLTKQIFLIFMQLEMFQVLHGWAHIASAQAHVAVEHSVGFGPKPINYNFIPAAHIVNLRLDLLVILKKMR